MVLENWQKIYIAKGFELLSDVYINSSTKYLTRHLKCLYEWYTKPNKIQQGVGCPNCAGNIKFIYSEVQIIYNNKGLQLCTDIYI